MADTDLLPCPFCGKAMMLRGALWPSEGDRDGIIHAEPTDCPLYEFSNDTADESIIEVWNRRAPSPSPAPVLATFNRWWNASKYRQVIYAGASEQQIARDGWDAALTSLSQPAKGEGEGVSRVLLKSEDEVAEFTFSTKAEMDAFLMAHRADPNGWSVTDILEYQCSTAARAIDALSEIECEREEGE